MAVVPPPGSPEALAAGCLCDPVANRDGEGASDAVPGLWFVFNQTCPLHGAGDWLADEATMMNVRIMPPTVKQLGDPRERKATWTLLPTAPGVCSQCGVDHEPEQPHDAASLRYQYAFYAEHDRWPTWADALAHCAPDVRAAWAERLREHGIEVEP
jgi:hypothetical protein